LALGALLRLDLYFNFTTTTGFEIGEITPMLNASSDRDDEQIPAAPANPCTKPGDLRPAASSTWRLRPGAHARAWAL
jgi:hypothetical protein